jgi:hypothetical protein
MGHVQVQASNQWQHNGREDQHVEVGYEVSKTACDENTSFLRFH